MIEKQLNHYRVISRLGEGGMGEVYLAEDSKLHRKVALKVLPSEMASDRERLARFQREARAVAALNHPNIVTIYSVEESEGLHFISMELVEGKSLDAHLTEGGLSVEKFLEIAVPLVEALSAAHSKGITHRDLKPQNVMVGDGGRIKVLDFGLAKLAASGIDESHDSAVPTESRTREGVLVGTVPYMSPEQVEGRRVDPRSDVFSLGVVMYEMATGQRPFRGGTAMATLSSILKDEPAPIRHSKPEFPEQVGTVIERCLAKDPSERYPDARELARHLTDQEILPAQTRKWLVSDELAEPYLEGLVKAAGLEVGRVAAPSTETRRPFVGRAAEHGKLAARLDALFRNRGGLVLVGGEPGVGKTRLAEELLADARERGLSALTGRCYEEGGVPYGPFVEVLEQMVREVPAGALRQALGDAASDVARLVPELYRTFDDIPEPMELPPDQQRRHTFNGILALFQRSSARRPLVLLLDDLHWADEATLALLQHVAPHLKEVAVLALGTYRDVELDVGKPFERAMATLVRQKLAERIPLKRLSQAAVAELLEALGGAPPPEALVDVIFDETEGNPFFVGEVFEHLSEEGKLFDETGAWKRDVSVDELDVPEGVRLVIGRRLERLSETTPKVLTAAAVFGRRFDLRVVEAVSSLDADAFLDAVEEAETARLIAPESTYRDLTYAFTHELIRQTLVSSLSLPRRQRLHQRIADAIETTYPNELDARASDLAHHLYQSGSASELTKTLRYLEATADTALASGAPEEAVAACERALGLDEDDEGGRKPWLLFKRGTARRALGDWVAAASDWKKGLPSFEESGDGETVARICYDLAYGCLWENRLADALALVDRGLKTVGDETSAAHCRLLAVGSIAHELNDDYGRALEQSDRAVAMAEALEDERLLGGEALVARLYLLYEHMMLTEFHPTAERATELTRRAGSPWDQSTVLGVAQAGWQLEGRFVSMEQNLAETEALSIREGNLGSLLYVKQSKAYLALAHGDLDDASQSIQALIDFCSEGQLPWVSFMYATRGMVQLWKGTSEALDSLATGVRLAPGCPAWEGLELGYQLVGMAYLGEVLDEAHLEKLRDGLPRPGEKSGSGRWILLAGMIESFAHVGRDDDAAALCPLVEGLLDRDAVLCGALGLVEKAAGIAAACARKWDEAAAHFDTALRLAEALPHRLEQAEVRRWYARMMPERGEARKLLKEAHTIYRKLGMPEHVGMVEALL